MAMLSPAAVAEKLGIPKATVFHLERKDPTFPRGARLTPKLVRSNETAIDEWLKTKESTHGPNDRPSGQ